VLTVFHASKPQSLDAEPQSKTMSPQPEARRGALLPDPVLPPSCAHSQLVLRVIPVMPPPCASGGWRIGLIQQGFGRPNSYGSQSIATEIGGRRRADQEMSWVGREGPRNSCL